MMMKENNVAVHTIREKRNIKAASLDVKYLGTEPKPGGVVGSGFDPAFASALQWYNYNNEQEDHKKALLEYLAMIDADKTYIKRIKTVPKNYVIGTIGAISRLLVRKWTMPDAVIERHHVRIDDLLKYAVADKPVVVEVDKRYVPTKDVILKGIIDEQIDALLNDVDHNYSLYNELTKGQYSVIVTNAIIPWLQALVDEFDLEGYEDLSKVTKKKWVAFHQAMVDDATRFVNNKKAVRSPRKKKTISTEKLIAALKYQKAFPDLKISSIAPQMVIKAKQIWIYNTKYRTLTVFNSLTEDGMSVKGTTLINFDPKTSVTKTLRKPEVSIQSVLGAGKVELRKLMDNITTKPGLTTGRFNENTIILRAIA
jgi:hypothetical protein